MLNKRPIVLMVMLYFLYTPLNAQNIFYKSLTDSIVNTLNVDTFNVKIRKSDPLYKYKSYFNYVLRFYPHLDYKKIIVQSSKSSKLSDVKSKGVNMIAPPEERVYTLLISSTAKSLIDTVKFENLSIDSKIAFISKQISLVQVYSTSGFFDIIGLYFKKHSVKHSKYLKKDVNLKSIEAGLGYQLMTYTNEVLDKLQEDNWIDKNAYKKHYTKNTHALMNYVEIRTYLYDYPVYLQNIYK